MRTESTVYRQDFLHINKVVMRQSTGMGKERIQFYFNCPEKMEYIKKMIKHTNYKDIVFTLFLTGPTGRPAGIRSRLGRNAVLWVVGSPYWGRRGIAVCTILSNNIFTIRGCYLSSPNGMIRLGRPTEIACSWTLQEEEENRIRREIMGISDGVLNWEEEKLSDMQIEAEMEEALQGQVD